MPDEPTIEDDKPDPETGQTKQELAEMGWPMTEEPITDPPKPSPA